MQPAVFPDGSANVYSTVVVLGFAKNVPDRGLVDTRFAVPELSVAVASCQITTWPGIVESSVRMILGGHITIGGVISAVQQTNEQ